jgi:acyl-CoA reductase-like NAD-dependent aldehyde dehydrogenase
MATERAIVVDSVFDEFEAILDRKANEFAKEVPTLQLAGQKAGDKLQGMIDEALEKVSRPSLASYSYGSLT